MEKKTTKKKQNKQTKLKNNRESCLTCELSVTCSAVLSSRIRRKRGNRSEIPLTGSTYRDKRSLTEHFKI